MTYPSINYFHGLNPHYSHIDEPSSSSLSDPCFLPTFRTIHSSAVGLAPLPKRSRRCRQKAGRAGIHPQIIPADTSAYLELNQQVGTNPCGSLTYVQSCTGYKSHAKSKTPSNVFANTTIRTKLTVQPLLHISIKHSDSVDPSIRKSLQ